MPESPHLTPRGTNSMSPTSPPGHGWSSPRGELLLAGDFARHSTHNTFGSAGPYRDLPPPPVWTHHQVVVGWLLRLSHHLSLQDIGCKSDDKTAKVSWLQVHMWTPICLKMVLWTICDEHRSPATEHHSGSSPRRMRGKGPGARPSPSCPAPRAGSSRGPGIPRPVMGDLVHFGFPS